MNSPSPDRSFSSDTPSQPEPHEHEPKHVDWDSPSGESSGDHPSGDRRGPERREPDRRASAPSQPPADAGGGSGQDQPQELGPDGQPRRRRKRGGRRRGKKNRAGQAGGQPGDQPGERVGAEGGGHPESGTDGNPSRSQEHRESDASTPKPHHLKPHRPPAQRGHGAPIEGRGGRGGGGGGGSGGGGGAQRSPAGLPKRVRMPAAPLSDKAKAEIFETETTFASLGLSKPLVDTLAEIGFVYPTTIQAQLIPVILRGKDVLGQARTGTGKTAAFALPMLDRVTPKSQGGAEFQGLILVPTRELAIQVAADFHELGEHTGIVALPVYGGQNIRTQADLLARGPEIIVATPGRVMDMVERGYIHYRNIKMAVLDEVDRMLDIGFRDDIRRILRTCPTDRQTVFVSATISGEIESLARSFAKEPEKIVATSGSLTAAMVKQYYLTVQPWDKRSLLRHLLTHESPALTVVFCRMKRTVDEVTEYLVKHGIEAHAMHGDMYQNKRNKVIEQLRAGSLSVLIASDLASRGLDIEGITHVINYDLPEDPDLYVHRIGRTARAGRDGVAWSLVTPDQGGLLTQIELLINAEIPKLDYPDFVPGPVPRHVRESREMDEKRLATAKTFNRFTAGPTVPVAVQATGSSGAGSPAGVGAASGGSSSSVASASMAADGNRFPGGVVPSKLPDKRMGGRVKSARSMRGAAVPPPPPPAGGSTPS